MNFNFGGIQKTTSQTSKHTKVLIIGSGPAGFSAALYAARAELEPILLTGTDLGGQAALTYIIENYPGFPEGVGGSALSELFQKQAERFGTSVEFATVTAVDLSRRPFHVTSDNGEYYGDTLIIATGATPNRLHIPGETELTGRGVSWCATCDGWFFKEKDVVIVGGGDSALEEGLFLTRFASSVTVIHRRDTFRAGAILQRRARENPKMRFIYDSVVEEVLGSDSAEAVRLRNVKTGEVSLYPTNGVFIFIGHTPNSQLFQGQISMDEHGYILADALSQTSVPGVFAAGEVADPNFRQVVTSAGMGAAAAIRATQFLEHQHQDASTATQVSSTQS